MNTISLPVIFLSKVKHEIHHEQILDKPTLRRILKKIITASRFGIQVVLASQNKLGHVPFHFY